MRLINVQTSCCAHSFRRQDCYFPLAFGDYRQLAVEDFRAACQKLGKNFMVICVDECAAYELRPGCSVEEHPLDPGLRKLCHYPDIHGFMIQNGTYSYLEAAYSLDSKKEMPAGLEAALVVSLLRARGRQHMAFW